MRSIPPKGAIPRAADPAQPAKPKGKALGTRPRGHRAQHFAVKTWTFEEKPAFKRLRAKLHVRRVHEPDVDVHDEIRQLVVIASLPGVQREDVETYVHGDIMTIDATRKDDSGQVHHHHREILLPVEVHDVPIDVTFNNGLLEVRLKPKPATRDAGSVTAERAEDGRDPKCSGKQDGGDR